MLAETAGKSDAPPKFNQPSDKKFKCATRPTGAKKETVPKKDELQIKEKNQYTVAKRSLNQLRQQQMSVTLDEKVSSGPSV